ncbi:MAG: hypothetical protein IPH44_16895 [Myxococcales bacterium]|jgi:hypothetical protein|nr:hypothetical protein [Myxococcales bacterium]MBK7196562.1 hypothetical protein [Myxococcales bacterium]MBP6849566.1 hypothetical protein [Kofleriaceae bacterium]
MSLTMAIPQWLAFVIAGVVLLYGGFRMYLAVAGPSNDERAKARTGMLAMSRRTHGLVAVMLLIAGGLLLASAFGWQPFATNKPTVERPGPGSALPVR